MRKNIINNICETADEGDEILWSRTIHKALRRSVLLFREILWPCSLQRDLATMQWEMLGRVAILKASAKYYRQGYSCMRAKRERRSSGVNVTEGSKIRGWGWQREKDIKRLLRGKVWTGCNKGPERVWSEMINTLFASGNSLGKCRLHGASCINRSRGRPFIFLERRRRVVIIPRKTGQRFDARSNCLRFFPFSFLQTNDRDLIEGGFGETITIRS